LTEASKSWKIDAELIPSKTSPEGRIVAAGAFADQGRLDDAIKVLERAPAGAKRVLPHHLRLWYALADLHERAGDIPAARALFRKVSAQDPRFVDVAERLAALS